MTETIYSLSNESKASEISLELLRESQLIRLPQGKLVSRPVQSWEMIDEVTNVLNERNVPFALNAIWVQNNESQQILTREERNIYEVNGTPINKWLFNQLITQIQVGDKRNDEYHTSIAISFNKQGIVMAFGEKVHICQNMCVFGNNVMTTYGANKMPYDKMIEVLNAWMEKLDSKRNFNDKIISTMKSIDVSGGEEVQRIIGKLYMNSVRQAYGNTQAPFTISQMSSLVRELDKRLQEDSRIGTVWDLYNIGTNMYKPGEVDMTNILQLSNFWHDFLVEEYTGVKEAVVIEEPEEQDFV